MDAVSAVLRAASCGRGDFGMKHRDLAKLRCIQIVGFFFYDGGAVVAGAPWDIEGVNHGDGDVNMARTGFPQPLLCRI